MQLLLSILKKLATALLTEAFVKKAVIWGLEKLAASSENKVDDEIVKMVKEALEDSSKSEE